VPARVKKKKRTRPGSKLRTTSHIPRFAEKSGRTQKKEWRNYTVSHMGYENLKKGRSAFCAAITRLLKLVSLSCLSGEGEWGKKICVVGGQHVGSGRNEALNRDQPREAGRGGSADTKIAGPARSRKSKKLRKKKNQRRYQRKMPGPDNLTQTFNVGPAFGPTEKSRKQKSRKKRDER